MPNEIIQKNPLANYFITELPIQIKANGRKITYFSRLQATQFVEIASIKKMH